MKNGTRKSQKKSPIKNNTMETLNTTRHIDILNPDMISDLRIDVIGCGATGSKIALSLAKLGITNIHCWDFDTVESHNIPNQVYTLQDVGKLKVEALQRIIKEATGTTTITAHNEKVDGTQELGDIVFLLTDTMSSRKEIWEAGLKYKMRTSLLIETRMGKDAGMIYTLNPNSIGHIKEWENTLYEDQEAEVSSCGSTISVGPTADIVSGYAVWQFMRWFQIEKKEADDTLENEIIFSLRSTYTMSRQFNTY